MRKRNYFLFCLLTMNIMIAQVGIGTVTPSAKSALDINSTTTGVLLPRVTTAERVAIAPAATDFGLKVYDTTTSTFWYWNGLIWVEELSLTNGWSLTGNATNATNFIGTTNATDFVTKTNGSAAANERLRVKSTGQVVVNNTGNYAGDVFSAYANNTTNGTTTSINNTIGTFAVNGYTAGNGTGVYGEVNGGASTAGSAIWGNLYGTATTASSSSNAVWGTNSASPAGTGATAAVATGVRGEFTGVAGTAFSMGVFGINSGTTGSAYGVYGQTASSGAQGVFGVNLNTAANPSHGVQGQTAAIGSAAGVRGINTATAIGAGQNGLV